MKFTVKNWNEFQHYKDRAPPWVKLHKGLLDDFDYQCLPIASRALAPMLWLLASENMEGIIDCDTKRLAFRLRTSEQEIKEGLEPLVRAGFLISASKALADCQQVAVPETETEAYKPEAEYQRQSTEVETEIEIKTLQPALPVAEKKSGVGLTEQMQKVCRETWQAYADAYFTRYGTEPVRNQKTNRNVIDFCKRVSMQEAPDIARWYVGHSDAYYVRQMHAFGLLLKDAEKVRTEWATGQRMTQTKAKQADRAGNTASVVTEIMAERRAVA